MPESEPPVVTEPDLVASTVDRVRNRLAERRANGELPEFPKGELDRQFDAVIEAVDATIVAEPPIDTTDLAGLAELPSFTPSIRAGGPARQLIAVLVRPVSQVIGWIVRRQANQFTRRAAEVVTELARRQERAHTFLARAHLDRIRSLEYRVAQLEEELERVRSGTADRS